MTQLQLSTLAGCGLAIGAYPRFRYDARGGGGLGQLAAAMGPGGGGDGGEGPGPRALRFEPSGLRIPDLDGRTTRWLGLPLPPGLAIAIAPEQLEGQLDPASGQLELRFRARFRFRIGALLQAPDLLIDAQLGTGPVAGRRHRAEGQPLDGQGQALLVGVATVQPSGAAWLDRFLGLPDEALAILRCRLGPWAG
ncbi:hypothetical protein KBY76_07035 [Synechococcus sp. GreenBA-s]|nr:hypothetical protein [Synechococcus sp. GreenBA-s]